MATTTEFAHEMAHAIQYFVQALSASMTIAEMADETKDVSWKELVNRMSDEDCEREFQRLVDSVDEYNAYYHGSRWA